ncbi:ATP-grasp domain-containing protein [Streptomyces sp. TBY4]|uniref:ATP-grasp domain-containing protein n=1 Tax=Streptomyces sp. TBY4 TaxID=2962030 RepID=UPI0020B7A883|nr:ATP-grasp domain-containing protein [Streptomyces sp. TBY4]MCP3759536.1 ATP-grasp domain-containing protein [Streptomyces sp. TBY4]
MSDLVIAVLRPAEFNPLDCWGGREAIDPVLSALEKAEVRTEEWVIRSQADLEPLRNRSGILAFPHARQFAPGRSMVEPLVQWGVPFIGSGPDGLASQDKARAKQMMADHGVPTPSWEITGENTDAAALAARLGLPLMVKPTIGAESIGVTYCGDLTQLQEAISTPGVMVEEWRRDREFTVSILGNGTSRIAAPAEIVLPPGALYLDEGIKKHRIVPTLRPSSDAPAGVRAAEAALLASVALGLQDWARVDVVIDQDGAPYVIDINAMPGLRRDALHPSYFPRCLEMAHGLSYEQVILRLVVTAALRNNIAVPEEQASVLLSPGA